jgi:ATP-dependent DNA ligase
MSILRVVQRFLSNMPGTFDFCIPTRSTNVPATPDWLHEIKYDGYRLRLERDGDRVRLITRNGHNWTDRYPCSADFSASLERPLTSVADAICIRLHPERT